MNKQSKKVLLGLALLFGASACHPAYAQEVSLIDQTVDGTCSAFLAPILGRKDIAQLSVDRSIDSKVVCSCAKANTRSDPRMSEYISMPGAEIDRRTQDPKVRAYVLGRILHSVLACFSNELNATLAVSGGAR